MGADRDGWAVGRGFVSGSFISTASLPARARQRRAAAVSAPGPATPAAGAPRWSPAGAPAAGRPRAPARRRPRPAAPPRAGEPAGRVSTSGDSAASRTRWRPLRETASATAATARARRVSLLRTAAVRDSAGTPQVPRTTCGHSLAARPSTISATSPGARARQTERVASSEPSSTRSRACGSVAIASGTSSTQAVPTLATTRTAGDIRRVDHRVSQAAAITTQTTTNGRTMNRRRSAHGWSGVMPGRAQVSRTDARPTRYGPVQTGRRVAADPGAGEVVRGEGEDDEGDRDRHRPGPPGRPGQ